MEALTIYRELVAVYARMAALAADADWDALAAAELQAAPLLARLRQGALPAPEALEPRLEMARLIRAVLEHDAAIRRHVEPWMAQARKHFADTARLRRVQASYGAGL